MPTWPVPGLLPERPAWALAALGLVVGAGVALFVVLDASDRTARALAPLPPIPALAGPTPMGLSADEGEAARRPLFTPDRRPPATPLGPASADGPDLQVTGVVTGGGGGAATGVDHHGQKPFSVRLGDEMEGWIVDAVTRDGLRLRRGVSVRDYPLAVPPPPASQARPTFQPPSQASGRVSPGAPPTAPAMRPPPGPNGQPPDPGQLDAQPNHPPSRTPSPDGPPPNTPPKATPQP
ncbi:MAG: hypothetical protein PW843_04630 [Azospirillaceae bacterium]|nr:hypothetical protein [Azospirillaceae bacterium]